MNQSPNRLTPALIGGSIMGILSAVPLIQMGNCLCCMWILLGGAFSAVLYRRTLSDPSSMTAGDGAMQGLLAGIFGALFGALLGYMLMAFTGYRPGQEFLEMFMENSDDVPVEFEEMVDEFKNFQGFSAFSAVFKLAGDLIMDTIFGVLGGLLGVALSKPKKKVVQQSHYDESAF